MSFPESHPRRRNANGFLELQTDGTFGASSQPRNPEHPFSHTPSARRPPPSPWARIAVIPDGMVLPDCKYGATCYRKDSTHHASYRHPCKYGAACYRLDPAHRSVHSHPDTGAAASTGQQAGDSGTESASMDEGSSSAESEDEGVPPAASASAPLQQPAAAPAGGVKGKHVVFTGTYRCGKRSQVESLAATAGVVVGKGVTKNTGRACKKACVETPSCRSPAHRDLTRATHTCHLVSAGLGRRLPCGRGADQPEGAQTGSRRGAWHHHLDGG